MISQYFSLLELRLLIVDDGLCENTAVGDQALLHNTGGFFNVAVGGAALLSNMIR